MSLAITIRFHVIPTRVHNTGFDTDDGNKMIYECPLTPDALTLSISHTAFHGLCPRFPRNITHPISLTENKFTKKIRNRLPGLTL